MRASSYLEETQALQAKMIVLGDARTGKSCLINSLEAWGGGGGAGRHVSHSGVVSGGGEEGGVSNSTSPEADSLFSLVEFPAHELDAAPSSVFLKMWEHTHDLSKEEEELVFRGALFCIITLDLRNPDTANSAFNKWLALKESQMGESFLFVVGTFLDQSISRRVEIAELCKACAQRDAIYIEVSNLDGSNLSLLRRLIAQRINYMLRVRETVARQALPEVDGRGGGAKMRAASAAAAASDDDDDEDDEGREAENGGVGVGESKRGGQQTRGGQARSSLSSALAAARAGAGGSRREGAHKTAFLEQEIVCDSVGSILASCLGTEFWPGYEQEEENLKQIGEKINDYIHRLAVDPASAPSTPLEHVLMSVAPPPPVSSTGAGAGAGAGENSGRTPEPDVEELRNVFEIMGFQLPSSLLVTAANSGGPKRAVATAMRSTKLRVMLPSGETAEMILYPGYHVGQQVDAFLLEHDMQDNDEAKAKLLQAAQTIVAAAAREHDQHEDEDEEHQRMHAAQHQAMNSLSVSPQRLAAGTASFHSGSVASRSAAAGGLGGASGSLSAAAAAATGRPLAGRSRRVQIKLPHSGGSGPGQIIETIMNEHEDLVALSKRIAAQHGLTQQFQEKVLQQLRAAFGGK